MKDILNIIANTKAIILIAIIEIVAHSTLWIFNSESAKWHLLCWSIWLVFIIICRVIVNGNVWRKNQS